MEIETKETQEQETFEFVNNHGKAIVIPKVIKSGDQDINIQEILGHAIAKERKQTKEKVTSEYSKYVDELNQYKADYETTATRLKEIEEKDLSQKDKEILELKRQVEGFTKKQKEFEDKASQNFEQFKNERIKGDVLSSFSGYELHNLNHAFNQFKADTKIDFEQDQEGNYKTIVSATLPNEEGAFETVTGTPQEVFSKWIALESNSYLLKNSLKPGGGTSKTGNMSTVDPSKMSDAEYMQYRMSELNK